MSIKIIDNFSVNVSKPIDSKIVASGSSARWAIAYKYDGLKVFDTSDRKTYIWNQSTATFSVENFLPLKDGFVPKYLSFLDGFTNSSIYMINNNVGINSANPKSAFQVSDYLGFAQPLNMSFLGTDTRIAYNWYYTSSDQVHSLSRGSLILVFDNDRFTIRSRESNTVASDFTSVFSISKYETNIITNNIFATGSTVTINGTNLINLVTSSPVSPTQSVNGFVYMTNYSQLTQFKSFIPYGETGKSSFATFSISTTNFPANILVESSSSLLQGADLTLKAGAGLPFKTINGYGGSFNIIAGDGSAAGTGGSVSISAGNVTNTLGNPGEIYITSGFNGSSYGSIIIGSSRLKITDNDIYAFIHNKGVNGIGDSGNNSTPWAYPSISSGQFTVSSSHFTQSSNCSISSVKPCAWHRTGNIVTVSGQITINVTSANNDTSFKLKVPILSNFGIDSFGGDANNWQLNGIGKIVNKYGSSGDVITLQAYGNGYADFRFKPSSIGSSVIVYHYTYILGLWPDTNGGSIIGGLILS
jgi:hypothetical protein